MIELNRLYLPDKTIGVWTYDDKTLYSIEKPWRDNRQNVSCIPEGEYKLVRVNSPRFGSNMWSVLDVPNRTHILVHVANYSRDVVGCIGLGLSVADRLQAVWNSGDAIREFYAWSEGMDTLNLTIRSGPK